MSGILPTLSRGSKSGRPVWQTATLPVVWLPVAADIRPELGQRFAQAVVNTVERIAAAPLKYTAVEKGRRRSGVRRFPYGLFFPVEETRIVAIACFHAIAALMKIPVIRPKHRQCPFRRIPQAQFHEIRSCSRSAARPEFRIQ